MIENNSTITTVVDITAAEEERWKKQSIYRIPVSVTALKDERMYKPQMVSIGPYHYGNEKLKAMEKHKLRARNNYIKTSGKTLMFLHEKMCPMVQDLKDAYGQLNDVTWQDNEVFLDLMITDGCFILELLRTTTGKTKNDGYSEIDPIFSKHGKLNIVPYLKRDMLMLENQIPMSVLQMLYSINPFEKGLIERILQFLSEEIPSKQDQLDQLLDQLNQSLHMLDLYRKKLVWFGGEQKSMDNKYEYNDIIPSATELNEAGINIAKSKTKSLKDISFEKVFWVWYSAELRLPAIVVDDAFESAYLNLIAYERFHVETKNEVTSYIFFMDNIIDTVEDVSLLRSNGVIKNALGSNEAVAQLFNSLSMDSSLDPDSDLGKIHGYVNAYCKNKLHRCRAYCCHQYFSNVWVSVTVIAAILIFAVTILQTVYTVLDYHKPST